ncbi:hypothetical protein D0862_10941 [Hortaea werneckii]|uniref:Uncharacterized protein n=1 Tax=Hortaea werneckii TaxID=91943 RepID=A0A3M7FBZ5_HORWE|nr:hypothetical protein D0862_10941 [Hortaea werneckii]
MDLQPGDLATRGAPARHREYRPQPIFNAPLVRIPRRLHLPRRPRPPRRRALPARSRLRDDNPASGPRGNGIDDDADGRDPFRYGPG